MITWTLIWVFHMYKNSHFLPISFTIKSLLSFVCPYRKSLGGHDAEKLGLNQQPFNWQLLCLLFQLKASFAINDNIWKKKKKEKSRKCANFTLLFVCLLYFICKVSFWSHSNFSCNIILMTSRVACVGVRWYLTNLS